jgi:amino acid transporter
MGPRADPSPESPMSSSQAGSPDHHPTHLAAREVSLFGDFIAGITNVAPSTAIALTLGAIMAASGLASPAVMILVGLMMLCIAVSYHYMNLWRPSAAAQAMWTARAIQPVIGLAVGFAVILMTLTANISNITLFGPYLLGIIYSSHQNYGFLQWVCTAVATGLVLWVAIQGIKRAIRFQTIVVWIEYAIILAFIIALYVAEFTGRAGTTHPHWSWLLPSTATSYSGFMNAVVLGVFAFGGWEASVYLSEEGTDVRRNPGRAGIISVVFCIVWFTVCTMAIQAIAPAKVLVAHSANIIAYSAHVIWPQPWSSIVSLAVLSSVIAVTQSQLQNFSRMSFGLSRERLFPKWLGRLSRQRTPALALILSAVIPVVLLIVYLTNSSAGSTIGLVSGTAGYLYIVIYVAGAIACIWYYRRTLMRSARQFILAGLLPFIGGAGLVYAAITSFPSSPNWTLYPFIAMFVLIFPAALVVKRLTRARFFDQPPAVADRDGVAGEAQPDLVPADTEALPDVAGTGSEITDA